MGTSAVREPFGGYVTGDTVLHRIDPRAKLLGAAAVVAAAFLADSWWRLGGMVLIAAAADISGRVPLRSALRDIWSLRYLYAITVIFHLILTPGDPLFRFTAGIAITAQGLEQGLFFGLKIALLSSLLGPVLRTTHPSSWAPAFESIAPSARWGNPLRRLAMTLGLTVQFLPLILGEAERIRWAQVSRGLEVKGGPIRRVRSLIPLLVPLLSSVLDHAEVIATAMQSRGFTVEGVRTSFRPLRFGWLDGAAMAVVMMAMVTSFA